MSTDDLPNIDLNALVAAIATVELDGVKYDILPIQGDAITVYEELAADRRKRGKTDNEVVAEASVAEVGRMASRYLALARRIVYAVAPTIPRERVNTMMIAQLNAIAELATDPVRRVQEVLEKLRREKATARRRGGRDRAADRS